MAKPVLSDAAGGVEGTRIEGTGRRDASFDNETGETCPRHVSGLPGGQSDLFMVRPLLSQGQATPALAGVRPNGK